MSKGIGTPTWVYAKGVPSLVATVCERFSKKMRDPSRWLASFRFPLNPTGTEIPGVRLRPRGRPYATSRRRGAGRGSRPGSEGSPRAGLLGEQRRRVQRSTADPMLVNPSPVFLSVVFLSFFSFKEGGIPGFSGESDLFWRGTHPILINWG